MKSVRTNAWQRAEKKRNAAYDGPICFFFVPSNELVWLCRLLPATSQFVSTSWLFFLPRHYDRGIQDAGHIETNELMAPSLDEHRLVACNQVVAPSNAPAMRYTNIISSTFTPDADSFG